MTRCFTVFALLLALALPAEASIDYQLQSDDLIARVNSGQQELLLSKTVVDIFVHHQRNTARTHGQPVTARLVLQQLLDDALLAQYAQQHYSPQQLWPPQRVGFAYAVDRQRQRAALLRGYYGEAIEQSIQALPGASLEAVSQWNTELSQEQFGRDFALQPGLSIDLSEQQRALAKDLWVVRTDLDQNGDSEGMVSLLDIYQRQNVQGRLSLQQGNLAYLKAQARQRVGELYIQHWARQQLTASDWQALEKILINQQLAQQLRRLVGVYADIHDDNPALRAAAEQVSDKQLQQAYAEHRDDFKVVERVKVQRLQLADQASADQVYQQIQDGLSFAEAASRYSQSDELELGWLQRADKQRGWMHTVAFTQPKGHVSRPFRSPQNQGPVVYEIVHIVEREDGFLPLSDDGVRYELAREVAAKQLLQDYQKLQQQLRREAHISLNQRLRQS